MDTFVALLNSPAFTLGPVVASWAELTGAVLAGPLAKRLDVGEER